MPSHRYRKKRSRFTFYLSHLGKETIRPVRYMETFRLPPPHFSEVKRCHAVPQDVSSPQNLGKSLRSIPFPAPSRTSTYHPHCISSFTVSLCARMSLTRLDLQDAPNSIPQTVSVKSIVSILKARRDIVSGLVYSTHFVVIKLTRSSGRYQSTASM